MIRRHMIIGCSAGAILFAHAALAASNVPDIKAMLGTPYPVELMSGGAAVAWAESSFGVRNIWFAPDGKSPARQITRYTADDGQMIGGNGSYGQPGLVITPDGKWVIYVRGMAKSYDGVAPNPTSSPEPAEQTLFAVSTAGGEPIRLAAGNAPALADDGHTLVFVADGKLSALDISRPSTPGKAETLFTSRGALSRYSLSPDGGRIAFVSNRGQHSLIGVFDRKARQITWVMPDVSRDSHPVWSPDSQRLAFIRRAGLLNEQPYTLGHTEAFSLVVADLRTGDGKIIFRSNARAGGFAPDSMDSAPLLWADGDRLLFASEEDGWMRYYTVSALGGAPVAVTPPKCETEQGSLAPDGKTFYFSSNCSDAHSRNLWRVDVAVGKPTPLTSGPVIHTDITASGNSGAVVFRGSDAREPMAVFRWEQGKMTRLSAPAPKAFPASRLVSPKVVSFTAADGVTVHGELFQSDACRVKRCPALIHIHGGPIRQMLPGWHYIEYYSNAYGFNQWMALRGYVVLTVNYRSGVGYGQAFRIAPKTGPEGAAEYQDILAGHAYLAGLDNVDARHIGVWGGSHGGTLTATALARNSDKFAAGVDWHGVHDWRTTIERELGTGLKLAGGEAALAEAFRSSAVADVAHWRSPVLMVHGDHDSHVNIAETTDLVERLRQRGVPTETLILPDEAHDPLRWASWERALRATADFFDRNLK